MTPESGQHSTPEQADRQSFPASDPPSSWAGADRDPEANESPERRAMDDADMGEDEPAEDEPTTHDDVDADSHAVKSARA
jgi:hypothetical protein